MPMAAIIAPASLDLAPEAALGHYTHEKSPVGSAAALAALEAIAEEGLLPRALELGAIGFQRLAELKARHAAIADIRGVGAYFGVEMAGKDPAEADARAERLLYACLERGLSFKVGAGKVATLCPPLTIPSDQFERAFDILGEAFSMLS